MTAMDILEALGQVQEEMLKDCDVVIGAAEDVQADISLIDNRRKADVHKRVFFHIGKYRRAAAGIAAAAAVLLLVYVGRGAFISRSFDLSGSGNSHSTSTAESAEISADTAEEEAAVEESETVEMEEELAEEIASEEGSAQAEALMLETLKLGDVYIPGFVTSASDLSEEEYAEYLELVAQVQEEIDAAFSQEVYETLPVYRFVQMKESELLGDYPVITVEEAEELLLRGYYLASAGFSQDEVESMEVDSVKLQYLISTETQIYMPYYQFTVVADGDMVYICCVPAVSSEYLEGTLNWGAVE